MILSDQKISFLNCHLYEKAVNHQWLDSCVNGNTADFPHIVKMDGKASLEKDCFIPNPESTTWPECQRGSYPNYLVNIPVLGRDVNGPFFKNLLELFKNESFGKNAAESSELAKQRLAIVIGINQAESIDNTINSQFSCIIDNLPRVEGIAYRVFSFLWVPSWQQRYDLPGVYGYKKAYRILKALSATSAEMVREKLEGKNELSKEVASQIPYQQIRDCVKNFPASHRFATYFENNSPMAPIYFGIMDSDILFLRHNTIGLFGRIDSISILYQTPSCISPGYQVAEDELPLIRLGIKIDMTVRAAMNGVIPFSAYLPEPAAFFCIRHSPGSHILSSLSFAGAGNRLEAKRLIQNARQARLFNDRVVFFSSGGIVIKTPQRMKTLKNREVTELTVSKIKQKGMLQALRNVSQSHIHPKQWAENIYAALDVHASRVTDITQHFMHIFGVYDPISRMFSMQGNYTVKHFNDVMASYMQPLTNIQESILNGAAYHLYEVGVPMEKVNLVFQAAFASGLAIFQCLPKETSKKLVFTPIAKGSILLEITFGSFSATRPDAISFPASAKYPCS